MSKIRLGIIGLGRLGKQHAVNIHHVIPEAELAAICSVVPEELNEMTSQMSPELVTEDYHELLAMDSLDGVIIASSSQQHCRMICDAAKAGVRNVFTEKPIGMTLDEIDEIKAAVTAAEDMRLQVGFNRRFDQSIQAAKKRLDEGYIGRPIQIRMINRDPAAMAEFIIKFSPQSGGLVLDMLTHDYDLARWMIGSDARSVYGLGGVFVYDGLKAVKDIDNCAILVEFENGVIGQFETSRNSAYGYHSEMEIYGSEGCIRVGTEPTKNRVTCLNKEGINRQCAEWFFEYWEPTFLSEIQAFVDCIREDKQPLVGLVDGYKAVQWGYAATEAVRERKVICM